MSAALVLILRLLLALVLYAFLGYALYTLWRDLKVTSLLVATRKIPSMTLSRLEQEPGEGKAFQVPEVMIGRDPSSDYPIQDETVSSRHAKLSYHHNQWWVEDLTSTNGTFLNDERLSTPTVIISGDLLRCGKIDLVVSIETLS
ncbi:MAG TPA: FHA domain-containing protein [Anaerolineaceae bacterium]|nr:FHA domain-containing protein [Anaerolineaceae bacterium]